MTFRIAILFGIASLMFVPSAHATVYASPTGDDVGTLGTQASPVKTILKASQLAAQENDPEIQLAPGLYDTPTITSRPTVHTTIHGLGAVVGGFQFKGAADYTVDGLRLTGGINIDSKTGLTSTPHDFTISNNDMTGAVRVLNHAEHIRITGNHIHDTVIGIVGPGRVSAAYTSNDITIDGNIIERMSQDGIQIGDWSNVLIESNVIRGIRDPAGVIHNDDIQCSGGCAHVKILGNSLGAVTLSQGNGESSSALMLQGNTPAIPRPTDDVEVRQNALNLTASTPIQVGGVSNLNVTRNVACQALNGLGLTAGIQNGAPTLGVASWNIFRAFSVSAGSTITTSDQLVGAC